MSKDAFSDEELYSFLEGMVDTILSLIPAREGKTRFPQQQLLDNFEQRGLNKKTSWAFLRSGYWYLVDQNMIKIDPANYCHLEEEIDKSKKLDLCIKIFSKYEQYIRANYVYSLIESRTILSHKNDAEKDFKSKEDQEKFYFSGGK